jgi:hypothetical protein
MALNPKLVLSRDDYRNYRNVRVAALFFVIWGGLFLIWGMTMMASGGSGSEHPPDPYEALGAAALGLTGIVGGVAVRRGSRRLAPLIYLVAWPTLFVPPLGTIVGAVLITGMSRYLDGVERLRQAAFDVA